MRAVSTPAVGTATIVNNKIVYKANKTFTGVVQFQYTVSDGRGGLSTGGISITVTKN